MFTKTTKAPTPPDNIDDFEASPNQPKKPGATKNMAMKGLFKANSGKKPK